MLACGVLCSCASAGPAGVAGDDTGNSDGGTDGAGSGSDFPDAPFDPRKGWVDLGSPPAATAGDVSSPTLAIWNNAPVVAYSADNYVHVYGYTNDTTWTAMGAGLRQSAATNAVTYDPTAVVSTDGLSVVWPEWSAGAMSSSVRRLTNGSWVAPPGAASLGTPGAYSFVPHSTAAVDMSDGSMWIAYSETTDLNAPMRISVVQLLAGNLTPRGSSISATSTNTGALAPYLAIGGGAQLMTWTENGVVLTKRNPSTGAWDAFGGSPLTVAGRAASSQNNGHLVVDAAGRPIVAMTSYDGTEAGIYIERWDGSSWTTWQAMLQATPGQVNGQNTGPNLFDLVIGGADIVYVAWSEVDASGYDGVYVDKCTPSGCKAVGRGRLEASPGATPGYGPRLAVDMYGRPLVTWVEDDAMGIAQVHVWRFQGDPDGV